MLKPDLEATRGVLKIHFPVAKVQMRPCVPVCVEHMTWLERFNLKMLEMGFATPFSNRKTTQRSKDSVYLRFSGRCYLFFKRKCAHVAKSSHLTHGKFSVNRSLIIISRIMLMLSPLMYNIYIYECHVHVIPVIPILNACYLHYYPS